MPLRSTIISCQGQIKNLQEPSVVFRPHGDGGVNERSGGHKNRETSAVGTQSVLNGRSSPSLQHS